MHTPATRIICSSYTQMDAMLLAHGALAHLGVDGFMNFESWSSVCRTMFTPSGQLVSLPMTLPVPQDARIEQGTLLALTDAQGIVFATTHATGNPFLIAPEEEAQQTLGTLWEHHPYFQQYLTHQSYWRVGTGTITLLSNPSASTHWHTPEQVRKQFADLGLPDAKFAAFQTRNALHYGHIALLEQLHERFGAVLLHPAMGPTPQSSDLSAPLRAGVYTRLMPHLPKHSALSFAPIAMRMAGPREALWHAQIRFGYGAHAFAVGRDHAGAAPCAAGAHYAPYDAQQLAAQMQSHLPILIVPFEEQVYSSKSQSFKPISAIAPDEPTQSISGTVQRQHFRDNIPLPSWYMPPNVAHYLQHAHTKGKVVLMTGLSGAGKTTVSLALQALHQEHFPKALTLLDGDQVRQLLSSELGFSKEHRILNVQRMAYIAALLAQQGTSSCIAAIAPYAQARQAAYEIFKSMDIPYLTVHISTPLQVCEARDPKGLYAKARQGVIGHFTGVSDPYEPPQADEAHLALNLDQMHPHQAARLIFTTLFESDHV